MDYAETIIKKAKEYKTPIPTLIPIPTPKEYTQEVIKSISEDAMSSYQYAHSVLKGRFELGEEAISKDAKYSYYYVRDIIQNNLDKH